MIDTKQIEKTDDYQKVAPHAFVHFTLSESATEAINAAGRCDLILNNKVLKVISGPQNPNFLNQRRRTEAPFKMSDVIVEIGTLVGQTDFTVAWRGPAKGVNFLVDPFDSMCKLCFNQDTAFEFKGIASSPLVWYRTADDDIEESVTIDLLDDDDPWIRTT
ncbi:RNA-dependent RNA polymerase 6-like, partial [Trifolium medium]|nr:RNA-dependent RNA polymerase 6-like [Trifolium medium]